MEMDPRLARETRCLHQYVERLLRDWRMHVEKERLRGHGEGVPQLSSSFVENLEQLNEDWFSLEMFLKSISFRRDAAEFMQTEMSVTIDRFVCVAQEIQRDVRSWATQRVLQRPHEFLCVLGNCQRKTDELSEASQKALRDLSTSTIHASSPDLEFFKAFFDYVEENLTRLFAGVGDGARHRELYSLHDELLHIFNYLDSILVGLNSDVRRDHGVDAFLTHLASVILRISFQTCNFRLNTNDPEIADAILAGLVNLHQEIDPTNPEFLELNLRFLESLYKINSRRTAPVESPSIGHFCSYLLTRVDNEDLKKELVSLVTLFINKTLEDRDEGMHNFFAEIKAALAEAAFSHRQDPADPAAFSQLLTKLCLLKAELFLKEQLNTSTPAMLFSDNHFFKVDMIITDLRSFQRNLFQEGNPGYVQQNLVLVEDLASEIKSLQNSHHFRRITNTLVKHTLLLWLFRFVFFKAESFLAELLNSNDTFTARTMDQFQSLVEELTYFKRIVETKLPWNSSDEEIVIIKMEAFAREITLLSYSCLPDSNKFEKLVGSLPQLVDNMNIIKAKLREISQQYPKNICPKTYGLGFLDYLHRNMTCLLQRDPESIKPVKHHLIDVLSHLEPLKSFLYQGMVSKVELRELKDLENDILNAAYKLEYVVESIEMDGQLQQSLWFYDALEDIKLANQRVLDFHDMLNAVRVPQISSEKISRGTTPKMNETLVDLLDEESKIIDRLTRGSLIRGVVSIVGMPGSGKTTLARKVFNTMNVLYHFHRRAWCTVSQTYSKTELLLDLLSHIDVVTDDMTKMTDNDLLSKLRRYLLGNRYLIVLDDIWDTAAWNDLELCFPDNGNGSRILITSRSQDVASRIKADSLHRIRLLSDGESWKLLEKKLFEGANCPEELLEVGKEIAKSCQGLPLAIVIIAGLLKNLETNKDSWIKVSKSLSSEIIGNPENGCKEILELSYKYLPEYLKACFIYLGTFLEDKDIPVTKLLRFWMAEGFIQETETRSMEEVAEDYLMQLINSNLVNIHKARSNGKIKTCRLHDLLRDLSQMKAEEEKFQQLVTKHDEPYASFPDFDYDMEYGSDNAITPSIFSSYRLSFGVKRPHFVDSQPSGSVARSLIFFASSDSEPKCPYDISFICKNFKFLRILDLESIMAIDFPVEIGQMIQLRYLAVSGYMKSVPSSISNLWKLETLVVKGLRKVMLPKTICSMVRLRYLHVNNHVLFDLEGLDQDVENSSHLESLVSFSTPSLSCKNDRWRILRWMPNLRKLRCIFWDLGDDRSEECSEFIRWDYLFFLESLKIICFGGTPNSRDFLLPLSLKKLTLSNFRIQENHLKVIGNLWTLKVLKLRAGAFEGQRWDMREEEFEKLEYLELDTMDIVYWDAESDHLPLLRQLVLCNCKGLERIPLDFAYITTMQKVEVHWCGPSLEKSAKEIGDEMPDIKVEISTHEPTTLLE
ncbi:OLC1v1019229C1 [Oldenlandia corymbosa var. corymbosa]|uniref:OLC1v1019229C1 n=1 Tax=Oldenlandia corymbosa var. corymbosa TaxID=529605 RepID=A0AAV1EDG9_OLDCO|nr:OLC1v1019229C1 [Oldenlandia corymbosa var. corymbosa]